VYPREVEEFLYRHDSISDVSVVGVPDERFGEELAAFVILREGETCGEEDLRGFCEGQIAHFKVPRYVLFVDEFPMTVTGKIQKYKLREQALEALDLREPATA
jgi:fatty-acyl-CoA synthase